MKDTQLSVFIANRVGELARVTSHLARFGINIRAISVTENMDAGIVRMITSDHERAIAALCDLTCGFVINEVIVSEVPDRPGALSELCQKLAAEGLHINYLYATVTPGGGVAMAVFSTNDNDKADKVINGG